MSRAKKTAIVVAVACMIAGLMAAFAAMLMIGFDFLKLNTMEFETKTYEVQQDFQSIDIRDLECDVRLVSATDGRCRVECKESDKIINTVEVENDTLTVTRTDTRRWYESFGIWWGNDLSVTVYLPEQEYRSLYLKTVSGDITIPDDFVFAEAELLSTSGDISFMSGTSAGVSVKSTSGDIRVGNANGGEVKAVTTSGDIYLSDIEADSLTVKSTSGDIEVNAVIVTNQAELEAVSGDIACDRSDAGSLQIKTVSGNVEGTLLSAKNFETDTTSGHVRVPDSDPSAGDCYIKTTSGNVKIDIQ